MSMGFLPWRRTPCVIAAITAFGVSVARCDDQATPVVRTEAEFRKLYLPRLEALEQEHASFEAVAEKEEKFREWPVARYVRLTARANAAKRSYQVLNMDVEPPKGAPTAPREFQLPKPGDRRVASASPKAHFHLRGDAGVEEYQIAGLGEAHRPIDATIRDSKSVFLCGYHTRWLSMRELIEQPNFRIRSIVSDAKTGHLNVTFEDDGPNPSWRELQVEFAPEFAWRIRSSKTIHSFVKDDPRHNDYERYEVNTTCNYEPLGNTWVPSEITTRHTSYPRDRAQPALAYGYSRAKIIKFEHREIGEEQFLPSAFGIPDSVLVEDAGAAARNPLATYWIISIVVLAALAIAFVWVRRRRSKT